MEIFELVKQFGLVGVLIWYMWHSTTKTAAVVQRNTEVMYQVLAFLTILQKDQANEKKEAA